MAKKASKKPMQNKKQNEEVIAVDEQGVDKQSVDIGSMAADALSAASIFDETIASSSMSESVSEQVVAAEPSDSVSAEQELSEEDVADIAAAIGGDEEHATEDLATDDELPEDVEIAEIDNNVEELAHYEAAEIEDIEEISEDEMVSALESLLFATDKPQSVAMLKAAFQGTKVRAADIRAGLERLQLEYADPKRGVTLEEVAGGYQLRSKASNQKYLHRTVKARPFRLSGPALEVLSIVAYKQPCTKSMVDEIRGVESGHLMRGLLDRGLMSFGEKSELPGRPMYYETTRKFLEIFNLRNLQELPTLNEIDQLIPEGIGAPQEEKKTLSDLTGELSTEVATQTYSVGEEELIDISSELQTINTSTEFFEQEKRRQREKRDADRAQDIQERMTVGEEVDEKDKRWLARYELTLKAVDELAKQQATAAEANTEAAVAEVAAVDIATTESVEGDSAH